MCDRTSDQRSQVEKATCKSGRPRKIGERDGRALIRGLQRLRLRGGDVTVKTVVQESGFSFQQAHCRTFSRCLNDKGYGYMIARRKGIVSEKDRRKRLQYARKMKHELSRNPDFFKHDIAFCLDGVSFVHKHNPLQAAAVTKSRILRKKNEGLQFTAKGRKDLAGVKGVILKEVYEKMDGQFFAQFIRTHFNFTFARSGPKRHGKRLFIRDNDSSQRSKVAKRAFQDIEAELQEIPPRSPDINVIESISHFLRMDLEEEAVTENSTCETFEQFRDRVLKSLERLPRDVIDRTIESLNDRIDTIISLRGSRTKYYRTFK